MENYIPSIKHNPIVWDKYASAWGDIPTILKDIILRFKNTYIIYTCSQSSW
jgi:hypothetical protein